MTGPEPELPTLARELGTLTFPLQRIAPHDDDRTFSMAGARARLSGGQARGVDDATAGSLHLLSALRVKGAVPAGSVLTPLGLERRLALGEAVLIERLVLAQSDPVCFFEWALERDQPVSFTLGWTLSDAAQWRRTERGLVVDGPEGRRVYLFSRAPVELAVGRDGPDRVEVRARLELGGKESVRLAVAGVGPGDEPDRILRVMARPHVVVPTRRGEAQRSLDERLSVVAPDEALGEALAWAKVGLARAASAGDHDAGSSLREVRLAIAALACGDHGPARDLVSAPPISAPPSPPPDAVLPVDSRAPADDGVGADAGADAGRHLLVVARYLAWTGDLATVKGAWDAVRRGSDAALAAAGRGEPDGLRDGALRELVLVAEEAGDVERAERLRKAVGEPRAAVELGAVEWGAGEDEGTGSAALVEAVVHGLLGAEPDAPRGRLVLRPRLPTSWNRFEARNLVVGEAAVELGYGRAGGTHRFTVRQTRGGAPLRVILEPELEGGRVVAARVDGVPAELDSTPVDGRLRVPVQVVLDHERCVEVEIEGAGD